MRHLLTLAVAVTLLGSVTTAEAGMFGSNTAGMMAPKTAVPGWRQRMVQRWKNYVAKSPLQPKKLVASMTNKARTFFKPKRPSMSQRRLQQHSLYQNHADSAAQIAADRSRFRPRIRARMRLMRMKAKRFLRKKLSLRKKGGLSASISKANARRKAAAAKRRKAQMERRKAQMEQRRTMERRTRQMRRQPVMVAPPF